jgi:hypothetical protein
MGHRPMNFITWHIALALVPGCYRIRGEPNAGMIGMRAQTVTKDPISTWHCSVKLVSRRLVHRSKRTALC